MPHPLDLPGVPATLLPALARCSSGSRIALVGGAVRDLLLHRLHNDPWRGVVDLDLVVEGRSGEEAAAPRLMRALVNIRGLRVRDWREHGAFGTLEVELEISEALSLAPSQAEKGADRTNDQAAVADPMLLLLDLATARREDYPVAAGNPVVRFGSLDDDLARRDFTINAMALLLTDGPGPQLLDPHGGQADLGLRQLRFLHPHSLRDDPTRLLRAARYAARLGFDLAPCSLEQTRQTLAAWPWPWRPGDPPGQAPAALATRLRMELQLLLEREAWPLALAALQRWGGLLLLDPALQADRHWQRRLRWANRLGLPATVALVAAAADPLGLARRLQLPERQLRLLAGLETLMQRLVAAGAEAGDNTAAWSPARWTALLETPELRPETVALALAAGLGPRRPLLRWWLRWRHLESPLSAAALIAGGEQPGPALGARLRQLRAGRLEQERP
jgi:poly(A) polymerase